MWKNTDHNNSQYGYSSRNLRYINEKVFHGIIKLQIWSSIGTVCKPLECLKVFLSLSDKFNLSYFNTEAVAQEHSVKRCSLRFHSIHRKILRKFWEHLFLQNTSGGCFRQGFSFIYRNPDVRETGKRLVPDASPYKDDAKMPVFSWSSQLFSADAIVAIALGEYDNEVLCTSLLINVSNNVTFLEDTRKLRKSNDLKCDDTINSLTKQSC